MFRTILVALDDSERAAGVLRTATEIADRFDARLHVLRVIPMAQDFPAAASNLANPDPLPAYLRTEAQIHLDVLTAGNDRAQRQPALIIVGAPARVILDTAEQLDVDMIVIGSHGYRGIDHLLGTVAGRVANRAHRNVLVVHEH